MSLVLEVPLDRLRMSLAPLRGERTDRQGDLSPLPLRVSAADDGAFEILDGFKRLARWRAEGMEEVPVVLEPVAGVARKARLLEANSPRKTSSPMDEVGWSLRSPTRTDSRPRRSRSSSSERRPGSSAGSSWLAASRASWASVSIEGASPSPWR
jgi:hypothetical protein